MEQKVEIKDGTVIVILRNTAASGVSLAAKQKYTVGKDLSKDDAILLVGFKKAEVVTAEKPASK